MMGTRKCWISGLMALAWLACSPAEPEARRQETQSNPGIESQQQPAVSIPNPVAYWKLDDSCANTVVADSSGNGASGTRYNGVGCVEGRVELASSFDGVDDRIEIPDRPSFHFTNAMTVSAWVNPSALNGLRTIVNKWYTPDSYMLLVADGKFHFSVALTGGAVYSASAPAAAKTWTHVAGVFTGSQILLYLNGNLAASMNVSGTLQDSSRPIAIGNHPSWNAYAGLIDEVRLWNVALSSTQIRVLGQEVWPNALSKANSDPWLAQNHDLIRVLRPTVLALNFVNAKTNSQMMSELNTLSNAFKQGSRYRAYRNSASQPMLQYSIIPVDLRDSPPPTNWPYRNSTKYPRENPVQGYWGFDYAKLFSTEFAQYYNIRAPDGHYMDLCELINAGIVHEVWVYGDADVPDVSAAEVLELKPKYDSNRVRIAGPMDPCAGNGCFDQEDLNVLPAHCTRSVRIGWVNNTRGPGCFLESIGHGLESTGNRNIIPYFTTYWKEFADFNLDTRYGTPFDSWYACNSSNCLNHASACAHQEIVTGSALPSSCSACASKVCASDPYCCSTAWDGICVNEAVEWCGGYVSYNVGWAQGTITNYVPACQNAHFAPNSRAHYDDQSPQAQVSTCENFRMRNGTGGADKREVFTTSRFTPYNTLAPDCGGGWKVYWMQSMPGYNNLAKDNAGLPMLPWWPFMFY